MLDPVSLLTGAGLVVAGYGCGRVGRRRRHPKVKQAGPVCGCKHHKSYHKDGTGACRKVNPFSSNRCKCEKYIGPVEFTEYYASEIGG